MRPITIARNYAEALYELGEKSGRTAEYAGLLEAVASAVELSPKVGAVLMSPRVTKAAKGQLLSDALPNAPREFVLFLQAVVRRGRQAMFKEMANQYLALLDVKLNRVRANVTLARPADEAMQKQIAEALNRLIGKEVLPRFEQDPALLGGVIVRVGDRVYDGSVRRRMARLRRALLAR